MCETCRKLDHLMATHGLISINRPCPGCKTKIGSAFQPFEKTSQPSYLFCGTCGALLSMKFDEEQQPVLSPTAGIPEDVAPDLRAQLIEGAKIVADHLAKRKAAEAEARKRMS